MHSAPAVSYPVGRSRFRGWLVGLVGLAGTLTGLLWHYAADPAAWRQWLFAMTLLGCWIVATDAWRRSPQGILRWDGQAWSWATVDAAACGVLKVHLDAQFFLLLSLRPDSSARIWLWPERGTERTLWNALRRAIFSRGSAGPSQGASDDVQWVHR